MFSHQSFNPLIFNGPLVNSQKGKMENSQMVYVISCQRRSEGVRGVWAAPGSTC